MITATKCWVSSVSLLAVVALTGFAEELIVPPDSEEWVEIYDPPFKEPTEIPTDMPLRAQLLNQLRPFIEREAKRPVKFKGSLKAFKNWAVFFGSTVDANGQSMKLPPMGNDDTSALWLRTHEGWRLVDFSGGHSDAFFVVWPEQYGVPKALVGMRFIPPS